MQSESFVVGIDIGGTNFRMGIVTGDGKLQRFTKISSSILAVDDSPLKHLANYIREFIGDANPNGLKAISAGFPSPISRDKRVAYSPHNLGSFRNLNVVEVLEQEFGVPVFLDRDANNLLAWDMKCLNLPENAIVLGFYIGTGYGNSIFLYSRFLEGKNGTAGELGHIPIHNSKKLCTCGNIGCIEMHASGKRLMEINRNLFPDTDVSSIFALHRSNTEIQEYIDWLSIPIATEANIMDPDYVVIGGGVVSMEDFPFEDFEGYIHEHLVKQYPLNGFKVLYSKQDQKSGVLGAAYQALKKL